MTKSFSKMFSLALILALVLSALPMQHAQADNSVQSLPFSQDWTNTGLVTTNDNWSGVLGIMGFLGQDITTSTGVDPQTLLGVSSLANDVDVIANQTITGITNGGVAEFEIATPTIALQGSATADAPYIILYLNTTARSNITVSYNLRDIDGTTDNAAQPVALQYRVGSSGNFTNVPAGFVADATTGPSLATLVTPVSAVLPAAANNQPEVQVRVITSNAVGSDEWVGIDDITVTGVSEVAPPKINEFSASTAGTDVEYIEIIGSANANYNAYIILEIEGDGSGSGVVDEVVNLDTTNANGLFLSNLPANALENGSLTLLLVKNFTGELNKDLDTNNDGTFDVVPWDSIVDAVAINDGTAGDLFYGIPVLGPNYDGISSFAPGGASRIPDGFDTNSATDWVRNDFDLAGIPGFTGTPVLGEAYNTPGAFNALVMPQLVINEVDYDQPSTDVAEFVEIRNNGSSAVSLNGVALELANGNAGGAAVYQTIALPSVSLAAGDYFVVCANTATVANCDLDVTPDTNLIQNGAPDAIGLRWNSNLIDAVSYEGDSGAPYTEGSGVGLVDDGVSAIQGISRCLDGFDTNVNNVDFILREITPGTANVCADVAPEVSSTFPVNGATDFPIGANLNVTFSEPVNVSGSWFGLSCSTSGTVNVTVSGGPTSFTLDPNIYLVGGETCTLTVYAANVTDQDANDPPDNMVVDFVVGFTPFDVCTAPYTPIYDIQGDGAVAAITSVVTTQGVVVGDNEGPSPALRGFYIQDANGDNDAGTSDGIFVFNGNNNNVSLGDVVRVTGTAGEFQDQTQISSVTSIANCGTGTVAPTDVTMPFPSATYLEQFEGMLVRFLQTLFVTEHFQLGRFGQVLLSSSARLQQPTNVVAPGAPANALQAQNDLNKIILDDNLQNQNPDPILFGRGGLPLSASNTLRGGDTAAGIVGIMTYTWSGNAASGNAYRLRPINALGGGVPNFQPFNPRPASAPEVGGSVKVVGMNLLNFFNTFADGNSATPGCFPSGNDSDCRGASSQVEFDRQWPKTVAAIVAMSPDVLGVNELENDGYGSDSSLQFLVDKLNAATAPSTYTFINVDANTGEVNAMGGDAIRVALIYKPATVTPAGQTSPLNTAAFVNGGDGDPRNRVSLVQAFQVNSTGAVFIVDVNHLKSKGSACDEADALDGQGNCNQVRVNAATELMNFLATDPTGTGDPDILLIGDYNSYAMEDPITAIKNAGFTNLIYDFLGPDAYSYVFDGQWGYLDHALGSFSIVSQVTGVADYHINSDEPSIFDYNVEFKNTPGCTGSSCTGTDPYAPNEFRVSDHDPVVIGLDLVNYPPELGDINVTPNLVAISGTVNASVPFTDPDKLDTHTATWDWGDSSTSTGAVSETNGAGTITGDHAYATPGIYTITITVDDGYGNTDVAIYEFVIVYDPSGGFVTGGGWINSPAGAYIADSSLTGKATFGFVAKYQKGANVPVGNTEFQFHVANFNFKSTNYEWLVVAGSKAQFKGEGTINGEGVYKFMLTAEDGKPDTFRIKIWYEDGGVEYVVYDNGSQQPLGGGSIVVHK